VPASADRNIVLVTRRTRLEDLVAKYQTLAQARFCVEHLGADFSDYVREHETYLAERRRTVQILETWGRYQIMNRDFLPRPMKQDIDLRRHRLPPRCQTSQTRKEAT
jgi:hypothetical protein